MAVVSVNDKVFMVGNFWDFKNTTHGHYDLPNFRGYRHLAEILSKKHGMPILEVFGKWDPMKQRIVI